MVSNLEPEAFISKILSTEKKNIIVYQQEICEEYLEIEEKLRLKLNQINEEGSISVQIQSVWGLTLLHLDDLPYNGREKIPSTMS